MKGYLKIFVLHELMQKELTGYDIMKQFGRFTNSKMPSPGTVYPLLNDLLGKGLISVKKAGKSKVYSITKDGRAVLKQLTEERKKALRRIMPVLGKVYSSTELKGMQHSFEMIHGRRQLSRDADVFRALKNSIADFITSKAYSKKRKDFRRILSEAAEHVRELIE